MLTRETQKKKNQIPKNLVFVDQKKNWSILERGGRDGWAGSGEDEEPASLNKSPSNVMRGQ